MSETALRNVNSVLPSERRSTIAKKAPMKVVLAGPNDENINICSGKVGCLPLPVLAAKPKSSNVQMEGMGVAPPVVEIEYRSSEDLTPLQDPDAHLETLLSRLDSKDWLKVLEGLNDVRQLALFHSTSMRHIFDKVVASVIKALKNPRSALCKTAIMASADLLRAYQDEMLDLLDPLVLQLLLKATQDKRFVCEEAEKALLGMTLWISPGALLEKLRPYISHRNPRIRAKASTFVYKSVSRLGPEGMTKYGLEPLIQIAAAQLNDQLPEAREAARKLVMDLHTVHRKSSPVVSSLPTPTEDAEADVETPRLSNPWEEFCLGCLSPVTAQAVLRITCIDN